MSARKKILKFTLGFTVIALIVGGIFLISFQLIGSTIDAEGFIHEPFMLMGTGWLLIGLGIISLILHCIIRLVSLFFRK